MELKKGKMIRVTGDISDYRNMVLGLPTKDFRALQAGKSAMIPIELFNKRNKVFKEVFTEVDSKK